MSLKNITAKTGKATLDKLGQTQADRFGRNPNAKVKGACAVSETVVKGK